MRQLIRFTTLGALLVAPASAFAFVWPFAQPSLPAEYAQELAYQQGVTVVTDIDGTLDGDWKIEGKDAWGHDVTLVLDGSTGAVERAEMDSD